MGVCVVMKIPGECKHRKPRVYGSSKHWKPWFTFYSGFSRVRHTVNSVFTHPEAPASCGELNNNNKKKVKSRALALTKCIMVITRTANEIWSVARFLQYFIFPSVCCADSVTIFDQVTPSTWCENKNSLTSDSVLLEGGGRKKKKKKGLQSGGTALFTLTQSEPSVACWARAPTCGRPSVALNRKHCSKQVIKHGWTCVQTSDDNPVKTFTAIYLKKKNKEVYLTCSHFLNRR